MKPVDDYLDELRSKLKGFDETEQDEILEEIESHIAAGMEDGRFQFNQSYLLQEMGPPAEMVQRLSSGKSRRSWLTLMLLLLPFLFVDEAPYILSLFEFTKGRLPGETAVAWSVLTGLIIFIIAGEFLLSWRRRSTVMALWWSSLLSAHFVQPFFAAWFRGWPIKEFLSVSSLMILVVTFLPFAWLLWRARFDGLLLVFATLPLTLSVLTTSLWMEQINLVINFRLSGFGTMLEPLLRLLMWCGVMTSYFLLRKRGMRWFGISSAIFFYLFSVAVFISTLDQRWLLFPPIMAVWFLTSVIGLLGMGLDGYFMKQRKTT